MSCRDPCWSCGCLVLLFESWRLREAVMAVDCKGVLQGGECQALRRVVRMALGYPEMIAAQMIE